MYQLLSSPHVSFYTYIIMTVVLYIYTLLYMSGVISGFLNDYTECELEELCIPW